MVPCDGINCLKAIKVANTGVPSNILNDLKGRPYVGMQFFGKDAIPYRGYFIQKLVGY